ncbi:MAG: BrnT family toxin [Deltaproteobacteria bacterium]|nr:BrnT family toxin [Deltaproteobacteria bacterium]
MRFEWDEAKRLANLEKHGIDFADAPELFQGQMVIALDRRIGYGEERYTGFGVLKQRVMAVVFSRREPDLIRLISLRKANRRERRRYEQAVADRLGQD